MRRRRPAPGRRPTSRPPGSGGRRRETRARERLSRSARMAAAPGADGTAGTTSATTASTGVMPTVEAEREPGRALEFVGEAGRRRRPAPARVGEGGGDEVAGGVVGTGELDGRAHPSVRRAGDRDGRVRRAVRVPARRSGRPRRGGPGRTLRWPRAGQRDGDAAAPAGRPASSATRRDTATSSSPSAVSAVRHRCAAPSSGTGAPVQVVRRPVASCSSSLGVTRTGVAPVAVPVRVRARPAGRATPAPDGGASAAPTPAQLRSPSSRPRSSARPGWCRRRPAAAPSPAPPSH